MTITREMLIKKLSDTSGYYQKDIRVLLQSLDEVVFEYFNDVTDDDKEENNVELIEESSEETFDEIEESEEIEEFSDDEDISVQLVKGIKCGCKVVPQRTRKDPRNQNDIICEATVKPFAKFSDDFRKLIQDQYNTKKDG